ncbi:hypothetical protein M3Y96_00203700 [Aphelenchoides besseyi]|nr:hypothetical protein M3Y96_00203700 [Aphelenchoides besseyi]
MSVLASALLTVDAVLAFIIGASFFFFPSQLGDYIFNRGTDGVHWHLLRCIGGQILASAVFIRFRNRNAETRTAVYLVRILAFTLILIITLHARSVFPKDFNYQFATNTIYYCIGVITVFISALLLSRWPIGDHVYRETYIGNALYQLDSFASIAIGMAWIACPHWLLHRQVKITMDETHAICGRFMGALFVSSHVCFCILFAQIWSQIAYKEDWSGGHWVGISLFSTWTVISFVYRVYLARTNPENAKTKRN